MLLSLDGVMVSQPWHQHDYTRWRGAMTPQEIARIEQEMYNKVDIMRWCKVAAICGTHWSGTVYMPIYTKAAKYDQTIAAKCVGLFLCDTLINHPATWYFKKPLYPGEEIVGMEYFR